MWRVPALEAMLANALDDDLLAAACVDRDADAIAVVNLTPERAVLLAQEVMVRCQPVERLFAGAVLEAALPQGRVAIAMARRTLIVVAVLRPGAPLDGLRSLRANISALLPGDEEAPIPSSPAGDSGSGAPAVATRYVN